ncbi:unnamed protein product [Rotaria socialis]|uniref:Uncharacterized protein n=1 Tax=Rotaria socialis TaxID=392032 RepID=A0A818D5B0_9BILA|nr:unnamed protein product [Rotaria socialis]CAF3428462.1 unnamed protein product [Rotaria socialis]CAF3436001.1 unnamed protein product [Rotaria socialis]CAF3499018.1 unnamed protein product [Rotaria socialis]CAF3791297.1 unnamed protein product [Rotaria socialis]
MANARILGIVAAALIGAAWVFYVAGNAAPSWIGPNGYSTGLWQTCYSGQCSQLDNSSPIDSKLQAARAFMTLACIVTPFAAGCLMFVIVMNKFESLFLWIGKGLSSVSFIFGLIGMATGISYFNSSSSVSLGAAAGVSIVGVILNFIGAIAAGFIQAA